jgi:hypothetical protein
MRSSPTAWFLLVLLLGSAGCAASGFPPPVDQIDKVEFRVHQFPKDAAPGAPCDVALTDRSDIAEVVAWLKTINWSQGGLDLKAVKIAAPDGQVVLVTKSGTTYDFDFYWDGGLIKENHLLRGGDPVKLRAVAKRVCK